MVIPKKVTNEMLYELILGVQSDVTVLKQDVAVLKQDVAVLKQDVALLKQDVVLLKQDVALLKQDVEFLKHEVNHIRETFISKEEFRHYYGLMNKLYADNNFMETENLKMRKDINSLSNAVFV